MSIDDDCCDCCNDNIDHDHSKCCKCCKDDDDCCDGGECYDNNQDIILSSKHNFLFVIHGSLLLLFSLIDMSLSATIGGYGYGAQSFWTEFVFTWFSTTAAIFAIIPKNKYKLIIVLFTFSLLSCITTFIGLILVGYYVNFCRYVLDSGTDNDITNFCQAIFADFAFILVRFLVSIPLCVLSGSKLVKKSKLSESINELPRSINVN